MARKSRKRPSNNSKEQLSGEDSIDSVNPELDGESVFRETPEPFESDDDPAECAHQASDWNEFADEIATCEDQTGSSESLLDADRNSLASVVESSGELLNRLIDQFNDLTAMVSGDAEVNSDHVDASGADTLRRQVADLQEQVADLEQQNDELASQVASANIGRSGPGGQRSSNDALSWEDRKELIWQQMEDDSFDAESFVETLKPDTTDDTCDPIAYVQQLHSELERRDDEIKELQYLLKQQSETPQGGVAIEAAAIAELVDGDELIQQERAKLQELQAEWQTRFREGEIAASLERAKLSRERRELAQKNAELEEQLTHLRRQTEESRKAGVTSSRRWLAKLGLNDSDK